MSAHRQNREPCPHARLLIALLSSSSLSQLAQALPLLETGGLCTQPYSKKKTQNLSYSELSI
jgi:hypothetical protein